MKLLPISTFILTIAIFLMDSSQNLFSRLANTFFWVALIYCIIGISLTIRNLQFFKFIKYHKFLKHKKMIGKSEHDLEEDLEGKDNFEKFSHFLRNEYGEKKPTLKYYLCSLSSFIVSLIFTFLYYNR